MVATFACEYRIRTHMSSMRNSVDAHRRDRYRRLQGTRSPINKLEGDVMKTRPIIAVETMAFAKCDLGTSPTKLKLTKGGTKVPATTHERTSDREGKEEEGKD